MPSPRLPLARPAARTAATSIGSQMHPAKRFSPPPRPRPFTSTNVSRAEPSFPKSATSADLTESSTCPPRDLLSYWPAFGRPFDETNPTQQENPDGL